MEAQRSLDTCPRSHSYKLGEQEARHRLVWPHLHHCMELAPQSHASGPSAFCFGLLVTSWAHSVWKWQRRRTSIFSSIISFFLLLPKWMPSSAIVQASPSEWMLLPKCMWWGEGSLAWWHQENILGKTTSHGSFLVEDFALFCLVYKPQLFACLAQLRSSDVPLLGKRH